MNDKDEMGDTGKWGLFSQFCHTNCAEMSLSALPIQIKTHLLINASAGKEHNLPTRRQDFITRGYSVNPKSKKVIEEIA